jgi:CheY-like chemotaxis protein
MPTYYFHLRDGHDELLDPDGRELASLEAVRTAVVEGARDTISHEFRRSGAIDLRYRIDAANDLGEIVYSLPFSDAVDIIPAETRSSPDASTSGTAVTNPRLLLLAEDEPLVLLVAQHALEARGFAVLTADSGEEALSAVGRHIAELAGLITDIRLGDGPDGWEVAACARELKPDIPVVYTTADSAREWSARGVPESVVLQKPYDAAGVVTAISTLLRDQTTTPS